MTSTPTQVTLSLGGTSLAADVVDAALLFSCADRALYEAKHNGRNQVRLWVDGAPAPAPGTEPPRQAPPNELRSA
jgi:predicted signal transduction protein with EAL and GGDEF domain